MSRDNATGLFRDSIHKMDKVFKRELVDKPEADRELYEALRDILCAVFMLACDAVYRDKDTPPNA